MEPFYYGTILWINRTKLQILLGREPSNIFQESKGKITSLVKEGICIFDMFLAPTCLQTDWSKEGIGYLLLQKHYHCTTRIFSVLSQWLAFCICQFTLFSLSESRYSPIFFFSRMGFPTHIYGLLWISCSRVNRFSDWICVYSFPTGEATINTLISICRHLFTSYGAAVEIRSNGGPQLTATKFQEFLQAWGVKHFISSVLYPQYNQAKLGVKAAKRIIYNNLSPNGSLAKDCAASTILQ